MSEAIDDTTFVISSWIFKLPLCDPGWGTSAMLLDQFGFSLPKPEKHDDPWLKSRKTMDLVLSSI